MTIRSQKKVNANTSTDTHIRGLKQINPQLMQIPQKSTKEASRSNMAKQQNTIYLSINKYVFSINNSETTFYHQLLQYRRVCCVFSQLQYTYIEANKNNYLKGENRLLIFKALLNRYLQSRYKQTLDQSECSFPVNHPKTMGIKIAGTVKSHHSKKQNNNN